MYWKLLNFPSKNWNHVLQFFFCFDSFEAYLYITGGGQEMCLDA